MTPSLLPRGPLFQGLVSGAAGAIGYGLGVFIVWLVRYMASKDSSPRAPRWAWLALVVVGIIGQILMIIWFHVWQDDVRDLMGVPRLGFWDHPLAAVLAIVVLFVFVEIGQLIGKLVRFLVRQLNRVAPPRVSAVVVVVLLLALSIALLNGVVVRVRDEHASTRRSPRSTTRPIPIFRRRCRRCGPAVRSRLASWESLGHQGRVFVSAGPTVEELSKFNGRPATEPIRAYAGLHSADGIKATAALAAEELRRTGGLDRDVVAVATTTGTGWINEAEASALEYMYNGDTAIVSMQYSFLPSWLSFLVDKENARQAGQALFEAVDAMIREMPEAQRPKLVVFGESLGSFGGEAPFLSLNNLIARTDGALFSGPTFNNTIWVDLTHNRDKGSPEWLPILTRGRTSASWRGRTTSAARTTRGANREWPTSNTRRIRSPGGTPICCSRSPTGCVSRAVTTCRRGCSGSRWSRSCRCQPTWRWRWTSPTGTATSTSRTSPTPGRRCCNRRGGRRRRPSDCARC